MYANYWGLAETPFRNTLDARWFYESPVHEEALARLLFLIENQRRCGAGYAMCFGLPLRRGLPRNGGMSASASPSLALKYLIVR